MSDERRRFKRVPVKIGVRIFQEGKSEPIAGEIRNISERGAFVFSEKHLPSGEKILLEIKLDKLEYLHGLVVELDKELKKSEKKVEKAVVRWTYKLTENGFGIEFTDLSPKIKKILKEIADQSEEEE